MKKTFILLAIISLIKCSNSDELHLYPDYIVGTWELQSKFISEEHSLLLNECDRKNRYIFRDDKTIDFKEYRENSNENCVLINEEYSYEKYKVENDILEMSGTLYVTPSQEDSFTRLNLIKFPNENTLEIYYFDANMKPHSFASEIWKRID